MKLGALFFTVFPPVALAFFLYGTASPPWDAMRIAGLVLAVFGLAMLTLARIQLGNAFSITPQARALVTRGIYSRIRNPIYVFGAIVITGLVLYVRKPILLFLLLILIPAQMARARAEARVLEQRFGEEYRQYRQSTWF